MADDAQPRHWRRPEAGSLLRSSFGSAARWLSQAREEQRRKARSRQCSGAARRTPAIQNVLHVGWFGGARESPSARLRSSSQCSIAGGHGCDAGPGGRPRSIASQSAALVFGSVFMKSTTSQISLSLRDGAQAGIAVNRIFLVTQNNAASVVSSASSPGGGLRIEPDRHRAHRWQEVIYTMPIIAEIRALLLSDEAAEPLVPICGEVRGSTRIDLIEIKTRDTGRGQTSASRFPRTALRLGSRRCRTRRKGEKIMSTNNADAHTTASGHCDCESHAGNAVEENRDAQQHSMRDGCCGNSAKLARQTHGHAPVHPLAHSKGGCCCSHAGPTANS